MVSAIDMLLYTMSGAKGEPLLHLKGRKISNNKNIVRIA